MTGSATETAKAAYVRAQQQTRYHNCHGGCGAQVKPAMWGCHSCWRKLPLYIRDRIWLHFRPGQENDGKPSEAYLQVALEAQRFLSRTVTP